MRRVHDNVAVGAARRRDTIGLDDVVAVPPTRLNPTDATLWDIERDPRLRTTIVAVLTLDRQVDRERLTNVLEAASRRITRLRQRVVANPGGIGAPHWEIDPDFRLIDHLSFLDVAGVVDEVAIAAVAAPLASSSLERTRPLWECTYLSGGVGASALVLKVHHSLTDGVGGIGLLDVLLDRERSAPWRDLSTIPIPVPGRRTAATEDDVDRAVRRAAALPFVAAGVAATAAFHPMRTASAVWDGARSATRLLAPSSAPLSPLLTGRSMQRDIGMSEIELDRLHRAAARHGCTINHAFFAGVIGGLTAYHRELGVPADRLRVTMPVSFRRSGHARAGNQWAPVRFVVPTDLDDPLDRMEAMRVRVQTSRRERALGFSQSLAGMVQLLPSALSSGVVGGMMQGVDLTLTNVPGLTEPHYLAGARVERIHAFAPTAGAALNVAFVSHLDTGCVGTLTDAEAVSEPQLLRDLIAAGLDEVVAAAETRPPRPRPPEDDPVTAEPRRPERLSALDTGFLRLESPETPMHIGAAFVLDGDRLRDEAGVIRLDAVRRHVEARIRRIPRFTRRIAEVPLGIGRPLWVDDEDFSIGRHVRLTSIEAHGNDARDRQVLLDRCAELFREPIDRSHALWELWLVDGLADGSVGMVEKVHHALIDGISGVELASAIFDVEADGRPDEPVRIEPTSAPTAVRRMADAVVEQFVDPVDVIGRSVTAVVKGPAVVGQRMSNVAAAARDVLRPGASAPSTRFNREIGRDRVLRAVALDVGEVHDLRKPVGATVNDIVLAVVAGAARAWFVTADEPPADVHVLVPVSTREDEMAAEPGNRVGGVMVELPVGEPDPLRRLEIVQQRMGRLKAAHEGEGFAAVLDALDHVPAIGTAALTRLVAAQPYVNFVVTNLPGSPIPLYLLGARIDDIIPVVPLGPRLGLGVAVLSYAGRLTISLFADPDACPDIDVLAGALTDEFATLTSALRTAPGR